MANESNGFLRLRDVLRRIPVSRSNWWDGIRAGRYPQGVKLSERTTAWRNKDLDRLEDLLTAGLDWRDREREAA